MKTLVSGFLVTLLVAFWHLAFSETYVPEPLALSSRETMPDSELAVFMHDWKAAKERSLLEDPINVLGRAITKMEFPDGSYCDVLKYNNKEIADRVIDLYIAECQRYWTVSIHGTELELKAEREPARVKWLKTNLALARQRLRESIVRDGNRFQDIHLDEPMRHSGETEFEYQDLLASVAESTFSEAIYPYIFSSFQRATMRHYYLSFVRPADTLDAFLQASVGEWQGVALYPHSLYLPDAAGTESVDGAIGSLRKMIENNELFRKTQVVKIIQFVDEYALHFADPTLPTPKDEDETRYRRSMSIHDYRTRAEALRILSAVGTSDDVPLVRRLTANPPDPAPPTPQNPNPAPIAVLAREVEESLVARTVD